MDNFIKTEGWLWKDFSCVGSTNDKAQEISETASGEYWVISAKRQTAGRGRRGRNWSSLDGNLFMSLLIPFRLTDCGILAFIISLGLLYTIRSFAEQADLALKWPNDVLLKGKKISGILLEKGSGNYMIAGIGVNLKQAPRLDGVAYQAGALAEEGILAEREKFLQRYLGEINKLLHLQSRQGNAAIISLWRVYAAGIGKKITVNLPHGMETGVFEGLDDNGMLILQTESERKIISAGDVFLLKKENDE